MTKKKQKTVALLPFLLHSLLQRNPLANYQAPRLRMRFKVFGTEVYDLERCVLSNV